MLQNKGISGNYYVLLSNPTRKGVPLLKIINLQTNQLQIINRKEGTKRSKEPLSEISTNHNIS